MCNMIERNETLATVRIKLKLKTAVDDWLKTEYAKSLGFSTLSNFMTIAARETLMKYRGPVFTDLIRYENNYELYDVIIKKKIEIIINKQEMILNCKNCDSFICDHILFIWNTPNEVIHLKQMNFLNPFKHIMTN